MICWALAVAGVLAVVFAVSALFQRSLYGSAVYLLGVLFQVALFFFAVGAQILGFLQVLIYAGAIMVLLVISIMSASPRLERRWAELGVSRWFVNAAILLAFLEMLAFWRFRPEAGEALLRVTPAMERAMAGLLFGPYAVATELIGVLILVSALATLQEN